MPGAKGWLGEIFVKNISWDFPGGPVVKTSPSSTEGVGSISGRGAKIPRAAGQLSPRATTREKPVHRNERSQVPQLRPDAAK